MVIYFNFVNVKIRQFNNRMSLFLQEFVQGFDEETAVVVVARLASLKMEMEVLFLFEKMY